MTVMQLHAVAHGNHHFALDIVVAIERSGEGFGDVALRLVGVLGGNTGIVRLSGRGGQTGGCKSHAESKCGESHFR